MKTQKSFFTLFLVIIFIIGLFNISQAQRIRAAVLAGVNLSQIDGDEVYGFKKWGANVGLSAIVPLDKKARIFGSFELLFTQKGAYEKLPPGADTAGYPYYKNMLGYAQIPVLIYYEDKKIVSGGLGFAWSRLIDIQEIEHGNQTPVDLQSGVYKKNDFSILFDARVRIYKQLKFNVRYEYSLIPIRTRTFYPGNNAKPFTRKQYNNLWTVRLIWVFNEKISESALRGE